MISELFWSDGSAAQIPVYFTRNGKPYLLHTDEFGSCVQRAGEIDHRTLERLAARVRHAARHRQQHVRGEETLAAFRWADDACQPTSWKQPIDEPCGLGREPNVVDSDGYEAARRRFPAFIIRGSTFIGMRWMKVSGNLMSLGAIDFGLIVDGAVIVVENALRMLTERSRQLGGPVSAEERSSIVLRASREVLRSATFGVAIIAIVYLPILSLTGIEGKMFVPMAMTVLFALAGALVFALTFVPALASILLPRQISEKESVIVALPRSW